MLNVIYAECHYAECHYAECRYAECRGASDVTQIAQTCMHTGGKVIKLFSLRS